MIQSHLIYYNVEGIQFLFYDTVTDGKHLFTACGIGRVHKQKEDMVLSQVANSTLAALLNYVEKTLGEIKTIRYQEIAAVPAVPVRIRKALATADNEDILFFVCRSPEIYDAAVVALNVCWSQHATPQ